MDIFRNEYAKSCKNLVIVGDFNFPGIDWNNWSMEHNENHITFKFLELLRDNFMSQHITESTRFRQGQQSSLLDLIEESIIDDIKMGASLGASDHIGISFHIKCYFCVETEFKPRKNFFKGDYQSCNTYLSSTDWSEIDDLNVHDTWNFILHHIQHCIKEFIPKLVIKNHKPKPKWMDQYCVCAVKKKLVSRLEKILLAKVTEISSRIVNSGIKHQKQFIILRKNMKKLFQSCAN